MLKPINNRIMLIILLFLAVFVILLVVDIVMITKNNGYPYDDWTPLLSIISGLVLIVVLASLPITREKRYQQIESFQSIQTTLDVQREMSNNLEAINVTLYIVDKNRWLVNMQTKKQRKFTSWFVPNEIMDLELIE